ncbi:MAG: CT583 family protein [Parachlamydiaceae bacterium]
MGNVNALLSERLKKGENSSKMAAMAKQSANGNLTSFAGVFSFTDLNNHEKGTIESILKQYAFETCNVHSDLAHLISITSEVKAINNQAALLHGERIKKAHSILINYRDGAFSAWLVAAYGNRQTPYNLMQYYEFCEALPKSLRPQIESMPRQAIYTLASREGPLEKKRLIVEGFRGQTKAELLDEIRDAFPLAEADQRQKNMGESVVMALQKIHKELRQRPCRFTSKQKEAVKTLLEGIWELIEK